MTNIVIVCKNTTINEYKVIGPFSTIENAARWMIKNVGVSYRWEWVMVELTDPKKEG